MNVSLNSQLRRAMVDYLLEKTDLRDFEDWFLNHALTPVSLGNAPDAEELVYDVELLLSEFGHGDWTEEELRDKFKAWLGSDYSIAVASML